MLLSSLASSSEFSATLAAHGISAAHAQAQAGGAGGMPSISRLQRMIEAAWERGFDAQGREQLGGKLHRTRKWIGATEIVTFLASIRIK